MANLVRRPKNRTAARQEAQNLLQTHDYNYDPNTDTYQLIEKGTGKVYTGALGGVDADKGLLQSNRRYKRMIGQELSHQSQLQPRKSTKPKTSGTVGKTNTEKQKGKQSSTTGGTTGGTTLTPKPDKSVSTTISTEQSPKTESVSKTSSVKTKPTPDTSLKLNTKLTPYEAGFLERYHKGFEQKPLFDTKLSVNSLPSSGVKLEGKENLPETEEELAKNPLYHIPYELRWDKAIPEYEGPDIPMISEEDQARVDRENRNRFRPLEFSEISKMSESEREQYYKDLDEYNRLNAMSKGPKWSFDWENSPVKKAFISNERRLPMTNTKQHTLSDIEKKREAIRGFVGKGYGGLKFNLPQTTMQAEQELPTQGTSTIAGRLKEKPTTQFKGQESSGTFSGDTRSLLEKSADYIKPAADTANFLMQRNAINRSLKERLGRKKIYNPAAKINVRAASDLPAEVLAAREANIAGMRGSYSGSDPVMELIENQMILDKKAGARQQLSADRAAYIAGERSRVDEARAKNAILAAENAKENAELARRYEAEDSQARQDAIAQKASLTDKALSTLGTGIENRLMMKDMSRLKARDIDATRIQSEINRKNAELASANASEAIRLRKDISDLGRQYETLLGKTSGYYNRLGKRATFGFKAGGKLVSRK